ncbi:hypothetical protein BGZ61DRAFT_501355 [Ilyonectria robusta]|uniref:uncharacterized protein n=1 Tax=Ilyonectria robusta TaxID=1079257 RepID=UPI001E8D172C|nr:uncharacterized protein BGZ61DRAFT_501355 [Ilyonectria robusta]KAH8646005.1 hypothetical protein BGZ61DRAFT_501355 [Ilyonectria robusta]
MKLIYKSGYSCNDNTVQSMHVILEDMELLKLSLENQQIKHHIKGKVLPPEVSSAIEGLWKDRSVQQYFNYLDNIARIAAPDYTPNKQDVLQLRIKTTGITKTTFIIGDIAYCMKWIYYFDDIAAILFLKAITLFSSICNSRLFFKTLIILFLNKINYFKEKLPDSPIKDCFPDYKGGDNYSAACRYIIKRFVSLK